MLYHHPSINGVRVTIAAKIRKEGYYSYMDFAVARCSTKDNFERRIGKMIATNSLPLTKNADERQIFFEQAALIATYVATHKAVCLSPTNFVT